MFQVLCGGLMTKKKRCLCDLERESLMLSASGDNLECTRYAGTQVRGTPAAVRGRE
jgi:hypothetical protein